MTFYYDSLDSACKDIRGAINEGEKLNITIKTNGISKCRLFLRYDGETDCRTIEMARNAVGFYAVLTDLKIGLIWYRFEADNVVFGNDGQCRAVMDSDEWFQLSVCRQRTDYADFSGKIMYQIMPDRFARAEGFGNENGKRMKKWGDLPDYLPNRYGKITNDDFFGGNFEGIRRSIKYLKTLGVSCIYLNPIFKAKSNHRYDTGDYFLIDELLGNFDNFVELLSECKKYDICIILDGVFNHTGDDSVYFNKYGNYNSVGAYQSELSEFYNWYTFSVFPDRYKCWWGIDTLPTVNKNCKEFEDFICDKGGVLDKYLNVGVGGVRLDVVDEIPDEFVKRIYDCVKESGCDKIVIGEVWEDATNKIAYDVRRTYFIEPELDGVMNYPLKNAIIDYVISGNGNKLYSVIRNQIDHYPAKALNNLMNILGTHDTPRILTVLGKGGKIADDRNEMVNELLSEKEYDIAVKRLKCASLLQFMLYGFPCVYYGDEIGMEGNRDPFNRRCFEFEKSRGEILDWYKRLAKIKTEYKCFADGEVVDIRYKSGVISFTRTTKSDAATIIVNLSGRAVNVKSKNKILEIMHGIIDDKISINNLDFAIFYNNIYGDFNV